MVPFSLPTISMATDNELRIQIARSLVNAVILGKPDLVVDVNASGILPINGGASRWTTDYAGCPWCVWWWDAPPTCLAPMRHPEEVRPFLRRLRQQHVRHFMWDRTLAQEYAVWFRQPVHWLPTATHPGFFNPLAAQIQQAVCSNVDIAFLGSFGPGRPTAGSGDVDRLVAERVKESECNYFEIVRRYPGVFSAFASTLALAVHAPDGPFHPELLDIKRQVDAGVGFWRRSLPLDWIRNSRLSCCFIGSNWPAIFKAKPIPVYQPAHLVEYYRHSLFSLELGNCQSHTGIAMRAYEIMASGGVLFCLERPDFDPTGALESQVYLRARVEELPDLCVRFRQASQTVRAIQHQARRYVVEHHSWNHRLLQLLSIVFTASPAPGVPAPSSLDSPVAAYVPEDVYA